MPGYNQGHALLVGVGAELPVTVQDASALVELLRDPARCAFPSTQVHLLTEANADRAQVLSALDALAQSTGPESTVIVYYSGHGYRVQSADQLEAYYLLTHGYDVDDLPHTAISGEEFTHKLSAIQAPKVTVLLDCCHAGGVAQPKAPGLTLAKSPMPLQAEVVLAQGGGRVILSSSRGDEVSYTGRPYSQFTQALLEGLAGAGAAEQDGYARVLDVALYVGRMVPNRTNDQQHPILKVSNLENNFAVAYYAASAKEPLPLPQMGEAQASTPHVVFDAELVEGYRALRRTYRRNLLELEMAMAQFIDQRMVPPDLLRAKEGVLKKIAELEQELQQDG
jgi:uncharacterized caspase-like protein